MFVRDLGLAFKFYFVFVIIRAISTLRIIFVKSKIVVKIIVAKRSLPASCLNLSDTNIPVESNLRLANGFESRSLDFRRGFKEVTVKYI